MLATPQIFPTQRPQATEGEGGQHSVPYDRPQLAVLLPAEEQKPVGIGYRMHTPKHDRFSVIAGPDFASNEEKPGWHLSHSQPELVFSSKTPNNG